VALNHVNARHNNAIITHQSRDISSLALVLSRNDDNFIVWLYFLHFNL
jgi:hypothetical protein